MTLTDDAHDLGRLLWWAGRPREVPARNEDYHRIVSRYRRDPEFAAAADTMFNGAGLQIIVDERDGVIVAAYPESPLRLTITELVKRTQPHHRAVIGAVVLAIARTAYPDPSMLDDPDRVSVFTTQSVVDTLDRIAENYAESSTSDGDLDDDQVEMWRRWLAVAPARPNARRRSANDRPGAVNRVCRMMVESGYLVARGETDGGTWMARPRFRFAVDALAADSDFYALVNGLTERHANAPASDYPPIENEDDETDFDDGALT